MYLIVVIVLYFSQPDTDECLRSNGGCEQSCSNTIGSFICSCFSGYELDINGLDCSSKSDKVCNSLVITNC